jgi:hypothetical protein
LLEFVGNHVFQGHTPDAGLGAAIECLGLTRLAGSVSGVTSMVDCASGGRAVEQGARGNAQGMVVKGWIGGAAGEERMAAGDVVAASLEQRTLPCRWRDVYTLLLECCACEVGVPLLVFDRMALEMEEEYRRADPLGVARCSFVT